MKKTQNKPKEEQSIDILKRVAKRVEEATVDIHSIKYDIKAMKFDIMAVKFDTAITKVDVEKIKENITELDTRLNKRITHVSDLITFEFGGKLRDHEKRIKTLEKAQAAS